MTAVIDSNLTYATSVPRNHVHRAAICEVFLTDILMDNFPELVVGVQLPRVHSYYSDQSHSRRLYDPLLLLEAFRQTSILIAHRHVDAPLDNKFVFNVGDLSLDSVEALETGSRPAHGAIDALITQEKLRGGDVVGISLRMTMIIDGKQAATMDMTIQWMPPAAWEKLRARGRGALELTPPRPHQLVRRLDPREVARANPMNVVISHYLVGGDSVASSILVDQDHPALFDHPLDHVPGALIIESMRQTAVVAAHEIYGLSPHRLILSRCTVEFDRFGELELPTDCMVTALAEHTDRSVAFDVEVTQEGELIAHGRVELVRLCTRRAGLERSGE